jgi:hypothetical protein
MTNTQMFMTIELHNPTKTEHLNHIPDEFLLISDDIIEKIGLTKKDIYLSLSESIKFANYARKTVSMKFNTILNTLSADKKTYLIRCITYIESKNNELWLSPELLIHTSVKNTHWCKTFLELYDFVTALTNQEHKKLLTIFIMQTKYVYNFSKLLEGRSNRFDFMCAASDLYVESSKNSKNTILPQPPQVKRGLNPVQQEFITDLKLKKPLSDIAQRNFHKLFSTYGLITPKMLLSKKSSLYLLHSASLTHCYPSHDLAEASRYVTSSTKSIFFNRIKSEEDYLKIADIICTLLM